MKTSLNIHLIIIILIINGCYSVKEVTTYKDLAEANLDSEIQIVTTDTTIYYADKFSYSDSIINISGIKKKYDIQTEFKGTLHFNDISYIQSLNYSTFQGLLLFGAATVIIGNAIPILTDKTGIQVLPKIVYPNSGGGGGSCPYIYSWNGGDYQLEGEAFGTALGRALETETSIVLPNLKPLDNKLKIKISNERPETHFFNDITLWGIETNKIESVYADNHNSLCVVKKHKKILKAYDRNNIDITDLLTNDDNNYWKSDLSSATQNLNFEDQVIVELKDIGKVDSISLIVSAINSQISSVVFGYLQKLLGDEFANFINAAETDPEIIEILKNTLYRSALKIDIWDGSQWKFADLIYPEANTIKFNKLVRLTVSKNNSGEMKIRLRCLSDVWEIDALKFDDSQIEKPRLVQPKLLSYKSDVNTDSSYILVKDDNYVKLLPGQSINLEYENVSATLNKKITYAINVCGYLYEWLIDRGTITGDGIKNLSTSTPKMILVKELLKDFNRILPIIYSDWREIKNKLLVTDTH